MLLLLNPNSAVVIRYSDTNLLLNAIMLVYYELKAYLSQIRAYFKVRLGPILCLPKGHKTMCSERLSSIFLGIKMVKVFSHFGFDC